MRLFTKLCRLTCACLMLSSSARLRAELPPTVEKGAELKAEYIADGFYEGPFWDATRQRLLFSSFGGPIPQILSLDASGSVTLWLKQSGGINGTTLGQNGRLLCAAGPLKSIVAYALDAVAGTSETIARDESWCGPNDLTQAPDGTIYMSDPDEQSTPESPGSSGVYSILSDGTIKRMISDIGYPNGIQVSLDGTELILASTKGLNWMSYPLLPQGEIGEGHEFFKPDVANNNPPDGMTLDEFGNYYMTGRGGVWVVDPAGKQQGFIPVPEFCSNVAFGGQDGKTLFITCTGKIYSLRMTVREGTIQALSDKK